jgi:hypothetical protein
MSRNTRNRIAVANIAGPVAAIIAMTGRNIVTPDVANISALAAGMNPGPGGECVSRDKSAAHRQDSSERDSCFAKHGFISSNVIADPSPREASACAKESKPVLG